MIRQHLKFFGSGFINSYSQLFFSDNRIFAYLLLVSSFFDLHAGIGGALSLVSAMLFSYWIGLDRNSIRYGVYSFNALMFGLVMGITYAVSIPFVVLVLCGSVLCVLFTVAFHSFFAKYKVPVLSLPFLCSLWLLMLSLRALPASGLELHPPVLSGQLFSSAAEVLASWSASVQQALPLFPQVYFRSLAAIFFQYNILAGILVAIGLLIYSRIAFSLSFIGFTIGYLFYFFMQGGFNETMYSHIGFNFVLTAITLGGYFVIPSLRSYSLVMIATPVMAVLINALSNLLAPYQLPLYSLPFNMAMILFMVVLNNRSHLHGLSLVVRQLYAPEKNLYYFHNHTTRYRNEAYFHIHLPFFGEWFVSQGFAGKHTHKEDWRFAWDFVVTDGSSKTYRLPGTDVKDYYCYNLPVLAPAAGTVWEVIDGIEDNEVGDVDINRNWGNTVIIKHGDFLYSKLSHLKKETIRFKAGDFVQRGDVLATCGSSGRSPEPHIHFQLQTTPYVGSKTIQYPISHYMTREDGTWRFHAFEYPEEGQVLSRVQSTPLLQSAFNLIPGVTLRYEVTRPDGTRELLKWEVFVDAWNQAYLYCRKTNSYAYFVNNGTLYYFTEFVGDRSSVLYQFYLAAYRILLGYYKDLGIDDKLPLGGFYSGPLRVLQDFVAPFHIFLDAAYTSRFEHADDATHPTEIRITSRAAIRAGSRELREMNFTLDISNNKISSFTFQSRQGTCTAVCTD